ncbi:MAG: SDR family NAD(P)-dependent oxidoreductase, partial [Ruminiclostridium sp.]|nr:SDR family NAD(P)-dependent oxidoreductase [Ruminiclostridium sp.]
LKDFKARNSGNTLNGAALPVFMAGPNFAAYYASKNYIVQLTKSINEELRYEGSKVSVCAFCPGPVQTEFNETSGVEFAVAGMTASDAAEYALQRMFRKKMLIVPTALGKLVTVSTRVLPTKLLLWGAGKIQRSRQSANMVTHHTTMVHLVEIPDVSGNPEK